MPQPERAALREHLEDVKRKLLELSGTLEIAVAQSRDGVFPDATLASELNAFADAAALVAKEAWLHLSAHPSELPRSIRELSELVEQAEAVGHREAAASLLERVSLLSIDGGSSAALRPVLDEVARLQLVLQSGGSVTADELARFQLLVSAAGASDDERPDAAIEVTAAWGRELGRAVMRAHLRIPVGQIEVLPEVPTDGPDASSDRVTGVAISGLVDVAAPEAQGTQSSIGPAAATSVPAETNARPRGVSQAHRRGERARSAAALKRELFELHPPVAPIAVAKPVDGWDTTASLLPRTSTRERIERLVEQRAGSRARQGVETPANDRTTAPGSLLPESHSTSEGTEQPGRPHVVHVAEMAREPLTTGEREAPVDRGPSAEPRDGVAVSAAVDRENSFEAVPTIVHEDDSTRATTFPRVDSFEEYRDRWRLGADGLIEPAPWRANDYGNRVVRRFESLLIKAPPNFGELWLLASAGLQLDLGLPRPVDVEELANVWYRLPAGATREEPRSAELNGAYEEHAGQGAGIRWKLLVALEALTPSRGASIPLHDVKSLIDQVGFQSSDLGSAVTEMLHIAALAEDPVALLRTALRGSEESPSQLAKELAGRRSELKLLFDRAQQRKLFRFETDFCQKLWLSFLTALHPHIVDLFPGKDTLSPAHVAAFVPASREQYVEMMDRGGARHQDRRRMDRAVSDLFDLVGDIESLARQIEQARDGKPKNVAGRRLNIEPLRRIIEGRTPLHAPEEQFVARLLTRALGPRETGASESVTPLAVRLEDVCRVPALLSFMPALDAGGHAVTYKDLHPVREAASWLISSSVDAVVPPTTQALVNAARRPEWAHLRTALLSHLTEAERLHALQEAASRQAMTRNQLQVARIKVQKLRAAASRLAEIASQHLDQLEACISESSTSRDIDGMAQGWLVEVNGLVDEELERCVAQYLREAGSRSEESQGHIRKLLEEGRFGEAVALLRGDALPASSERVTPYRADAQTHYPEPSRFVDKLDDETLSSRWLAGLVDTNHQRALRTAFVKLVFQRGLYERIERHLPDRINVPAQLFREHLVASGLNPAYVPQLARISSFVFTGIGSQLTSPRFVEAAADTAARFCTADASAVVVLLLPRITRERRAQLLSELRKRRVRAVVFDDLDLCRLTNPGGERRNTILGFLEIVLEQQSWRTFSPFELVEGQHVQMEMYVGRASEAQQLALQPQFTRLFSGRKLGKSALLRYVETNFDGTLLPSKRTLRVLYVSAVGIERAAALADTIVATLEKRFDVKMPPSVAEGLPFERLKAGFGAFHGKHKNSSLLVVLDEADMFVEAELEEYQRHHEQCLSFLLRSRLEERDSHGLPYVRFLFTGYRVTNTREGAWANWGDVLRLSPLPADQAAALVSGPLARLGIDVQQQAPVIAYRCGYQPAVLLRFGERLLSLLDERFPADGRDRVRIEVTANDVAQVAEDDAVVQEIRTVVKNNFYGNDVGRLVYGALLGEFLSRGAAATLPYPEELLAARLGALSPDKELSWLRRDGSSPRDELHRQIDDLVDRQLLTRVSRPNSPPEYGLRFPHHLPILASLAREDLLRDDIARLADARPQGEPAQAFRGLLSRGDLAKLSKVLTEEPDYLTMCPVFVWPTEVNGTPVEKIVVRGLLDQLGVRRVSAGDVLGDRVRSLQQAAIVGARSEQLDALLSRVTPGGPPPLLVGSLDLARAAFAVPERRLAAERTIFVDVHAPGRLSLAALSWWFKLARGFEFSSGAALQRIFEKTCGIPALVVWVDERLHRADPTGAGMDVSDERVSAILHDLDAELRSPGRAQFTALLTDNERRLCRMVRHAVSVFGDLPGAELEGMLSEGWDAVRTEQSKYEDPVAELREFAPADPHDKLAVATLVAAGYLPGGFSEAAGPSGIGSIAATDALFEIL